MPSSMPSSMPSAINFPIHPYTQAILAQVPADQLPLLPSPDNIALRKYSTSIDPRNCLTVYEYQIGEHWVIWDHYSGMVHLTGLWKAIGNNKADIVKLVESSPELEKDLRRIRGGYLKIQGTWMPYATAKLLASKFCFQIRYALIPLFGEDFVGMCLQPHERGFGMLRLHVTEADMKRRRHRRRASVHPHVHSVRSALTPKGVESHQNVQSIQGIQGVQSVQAQFGIPRFAQVPPSPRPMLPSLRRASAGALLPPLIPQAAAAAPAAFTSPSRYSLSGPSGRYTTSAIAGAALAGAKHADQRLYTPASPTSPFSPTFSFAYKPAQLSPTSATRTTVYVSPPPSAPYYALANTPPLLRRPQ